MNAIGYVRVSTEGQAVEGVSLEAQREKIAAWCELNGYTLAAVFEDAISGKRADNRPGLHDALNAVRKNGGALVVYSLSRLARSTKDALSISEQLEKSNADLVSLSEKIDTTSAAGRMVFRMLAVLSEFEREQIGERTSAAMQYKRRNGERVGGIPYGYQLAADGVNLEACEREQNAVAIIRELRAAGLTFRNIQSELARRNVPSRSGNAWRIATLHQIIKTEGSAAA